jgi:MFS family permease
MTAEVRQEFRAGAGVLFGSTLAFGMGVSPLILYTSGVFVADLTGAIGLTRTQFGLGLLAVTLALGLSSPIVGWAIDRFGVRRPAVFSLLTLAGGFALMATATHSVTDYIVIQTLTALLASASGPVAYAKTVSAWFVRSRGLALGITLLGIGAAAAVLPSIIARVIAAHGWRSGYLTLSAIALCGILPLIALVRLPATTSATPITIDTGGTSVSQALRTQTFWLFMGAVAVMALGITGLVSHFLPMLGDMGVDPLRAARVAGLIGVALIVSRIAVGALVDRIFAPWVAAGVCLISLSGCLVMSLAGRDVAAIGALAVGTALGGEIDLIGFFAARYFGLQSFGRIYGFFYAAFILGAGFSPVWMGVLRDRTGSYAAALVGTIVLLALAAFLFLLLPRYPEHMAHVATLRVHAPDDGESVPRD